MHTENSLLDNGGNRHKIEAEAEVSPEGDRVATFAFVVEAVGSVDGLAFVVATQKVEGIRVFYFEGEEKGDYLYGLLASVDVVADEKVIFFGGWVLAVLENTKEVVVLAVDVSHDVERLAGFDA